ncbi:hypothetical protein HDV00_012164 [Rhizophlyctis rosea]|nr:hypothetical protein HDV00_012164 [Rhizophlyctis rosea]
MPSRTPVAIVFGANGISGTAMLELLHSKQTFSKCIAVSRRAPQLEHDDSRLTFVSIDILKSSVDDIAAKLREAGAEAATHAFHYTYIEKQDEKELTDVNLELLQKSMEAIAAVAKGMQVFQLQTGYKYYGVHKGNEYLAPYPFKEDAPRHKGLNFYYAQEDALRTFSQSHSWTYIITRPNYIIGVSKGNFMNIAVTLALYAVICKEEGKPFKFPGNRVMYNNVVDMSAASNNAKFQEWCAENSGRIKGKDGGAVFNIHNGDTVRWSDLWPKIGEYFSVPLPSEKEAFTIPDPKAGQMACQVQLSKEMPAKKDLWDSIAKKHNLDASAYEYATWKFGEFATGRSWSDEGDMTRAREAGWDVTVDSWQTWKESFDKMKELKIIPA